MNKYLGEWYFEDIIAHIDKFELGTKIKSERGDIYNLSQAEGIGKQRKFSRWNGTKLRFMTYDNIGKKFEILEDNTEEIEELEKEQEAIANPKTMLQEIRFYYDSNKMGDKINEIIRYIKRKDKNND